jgi:hypothetical protein
VTRPSLTSARTPTVVTGREPSRRASLDGTSPSRAPPTALSVVLALDAAEGWGILGRTGGAALRTPLAASTGAAAGVAAA